MNSLIFPYRIIIDNLMQNLYFYTPIIDPSIVVVVDVVITPGGDLSPFVLGWTIVRPFDKEKELDDSTSRGVPVNTMPLAAGTSRVLLFINEPYESISCFYLQIERIQLNVFDCMCFSQKHL